MAPFVTVFHVDSASRNLELTCFSSPAFRMPLLAFYSSTIHFGIIRSMTLCRIICFALLSKPGTVSLTVCINSAKSFRTKSRTRINSWAKSLTDACKGKTCKAPERLTMQQVKCPQWMHEDHTWGKERILGERRKYIWWWIMWLCFAIWTFHPFASIARKHLDDTKNCYLLQALYLAPSCVLR